MSLDARRLRTAANILENTLCTELRADRRRLARSRPPENGSAERDSAEIDTEELVLQVLTAVMADPSHCDASDTGHSGAVSQPAPPRTGPALRLVADRSRPSL